MTSKQHYRYTIPTLPKQIYLKLQEVRKALNLTQREALILALLTLCDAGVADPDALEKMARTVKDGGYDK